MQLVEQHVIRKIDHRFAAIDRAAFASKNLYNAALYEIRQHFIFAGKYLPYNHMDKLMQKHEAYKALPRKVSQQVLKLVDKNWQSFFAAKRAYEQDPSKFLGRPKLPGYKDKLEGRNILILIPYQSTGKRKMSLSSAEGVLSVACTNQSKNIKSTQMSMEAITSCGKHFQTPLQAMG